MFFPNSYKGYNAAAKLYFVIKQKEKQKHLQPLLYAEQGVMIISDKH